VSLRVFTGGAVLSGAGFASTAAALNSYAAACFGARQINWMHASYGLGAILGPLLVTALLGGGLTWRWMYVLMAVLQACGAGARRDPSRMARIPAAAAHNNHLMPACFFRVDITVATESGNQDLCTGLRPGMPGKSHMPATKSVVSGGGRRAICRGPSCRQ
jgi:MFS family permease